MGPPGSPQELERRRHRALAMLAATRDVGTFDAFLARHPELRD